MKYNLIVAMMASVLVTMPVSAKEDKDAKREAERTQRITERLAKLTPEHFQKTASIKGNDALDTIATITTLKGFKYKGKFTDRFKTDSFIRAIISKDTGKTTFQIYATISYNFDWRNYNSANYETPQGPKPGKVTSINKEVVACSYGSCVYSEDVAFSLEEETLREIAKGGSKLWRFRFYAQSGPDWTELMSRAEVAGALAAVDAYRANSGMEQP